MPKQATRAEVNTFVRGLVTEASPLNYPANASLDEVNFELLRDGTRKRRLGMDFEPNHVPQEGTSLDALATTPVLNTYVWRDAAGVVGNDILVLQIANTVKFHKMVLGERVVSPGSYINELTVSNGKTVSFTTINGSLIIAHGWLDVTICTTNSSGTWVTWRDSPLFVRDLWGIGESSDDNPSFQPTVNTESHEYNLFNQGWGVPRRHVDGQMYAPGRIYFDKVGRYPSNTETVWTALQFQAAATAEAVPKEVLFGELFKDRLGLDVSAARGHFVIDLCRRGLSRRYAAQDVYVRHPDMARDVEVTNFASLPLDQSTQGAAVLASYAGRVFYAGFGGDTNGKDIRSPNLNEYIFFSQLVKSDDDITKCYQAGDPSSRDSSDVVETDGGFLRVAGAREIIAMRQMGQYLAIFATNGVWVLSGGSDFGFAATNMKIDKVSSFGCVSPGSIVEVNGDILFWGSESIFKVGMNKVGMMSVEDFSAATINQLYVNIPLDARRNAVGVFDSVDKKVRWLYNQHIIFPTNSQVTELVFDTLLTSYFQHKVSTANGCQIVNMMFTPDLGVRYLTIIDNLTAFQYTFSQYRGLSFRDWKTKDGVGIDAKAYLLTGAVTMGDSAIDKQAPYITMHFKRTETVCDAQGIPLGQSSCKMCARWEWANSVASHRISDLMEVYRYRLEPAAIPNQPYDNGMTTIITKNKLRGKGKALSLYFETSPDKDCHLLGWVLTVNGNGTT